MLPTVLGFYRALFEETDPRKLQRKFLDLLLEIQNVQRGSLWVKQDGGYVCLLAAGDESELVQGVRLEPDRPSIVGWVIENGEMTIAEAGKDQRHHKDTESVLELKSNLILCFPLILTDGSIYGAVQVIDTSAEGNRLNLDPAYLELLQTMVDLGSLALSNSLSYADQAAENRRLKGALREFQQDDAMVGRCQAFLDAAKRAADYAATDYPVLITGESGVGKEVLAKDIHRRSSRAGAPFLAQNCSAIPDNLLESELFGYRKGAFTGADRDKKGLFEAAQGGTVFLDEIGDMPMNLQARILRVLQNREVKPLGSNRARQVDVRIISATHQDLPTMIQEKRFREDLFFRLNVLPLVLPPLRQRREDIPLLLQYFMKRDCLRMGKPVKRFSDGALARLTRHDWPGNIRELQNTVKYVLATAPGPVVEADDLPLPPPIAGIAAEAPPPAAGAEEGVVALGDLSWAELDRAYVMHLLRKNRWNVSRAARQAGLNRSTFDSRMKKMGIDKNSVD